MSTADSSPERVSAGPSSAGSAQSEPLQAEPLQAGARSASAPAAPTPAAHLPAAHTSVAHTLTAPAPAAHTGGASPRPAQWTLYSRPDCGLCDELLAELVQLLPPQDAQRITVVDISQDPALERKYAIRIPVLMADGEFVCAYRLDVQRVRTYLD